MRKRLLIGALAVGTVFAVGFGLVLYRDSLSHGVRGSSTTEFVTTQAPKAPRIRGVIAWPSFGFGPSRLHIGPAGSDRPPYRVAWVAGGNSLLEFPPVVGYERLFIASASGDLFALSAKTGARAWTLHERRCVAASPAIGRYDGGTVYQTFLARQPCAHRRHPDGEVVAVSVGAGRVRWRTPLGPSETSPLLAGRSLYVGDWRGYIYRLDSRTGRVRWRFHAGGAIKGAVALSGGRLFAGAYDGHVYALNASSGRLIWQASSDPRFFGHGTFYSAPAVAYGRVYIGSTDDRVYSFGATSGKRRWSYVTGGYVYGSPAVWKRLVYVGSYDHYFYALDAATGERRWRFHANGPISGSATVLNGFVYFATLKGRTYALNSRTGRLRWSFPDGKYAAVVADAKRVYLVGFAKLYGLSPASTKPKRTHARQRR